MERKQSADVRRVLDAACSGGASTEVRVYIAKEGGAAMVHFAPVGGGLSTEAVCWMTPESLETLRDAINAALVTAEPVPGAAERAREFDMQDVPF